MWTKNNILIFNPHSTQKLSRIIGSLVEMGIVRKAKSKSLGRMVYRLTSKMKEDGYEVDDSAAAFARKWTGTSWDVEDEQGFFYNSEDGEE